MQSSVSQLQNGISDFTRLSVVGDFSLVGNLHDSTGAVGTSGMVLSSAGNGVAWVATSSLGIIGVGGSAATGSVTSIALSVPTGFTVTGSPITSAGTLALAYAAGYEGLFASFVY